MAIIRKDEDLSKPDYATVHEHALQLEKRLSRCIRIVDETHKINFWHRLKEKLFKKPCDICKRMGEIR
jgi:hypothetical protein